MVWILNILRFAEIVEEINPEELQRLLRLLVRKVEWQPGGGAQGGVLHLSASERRKNQL